MRQPDDHLTIRGDGQHDPWPRNPDEIRATRRRKVYRRPPPLWALALHWLFVALVTALAVAGTLLAFALFASGRGPL